ncbi:Gfo/Idh/MocA family protein [Jeotgalibacillus proteolyticus]|uniref:Gfo/Idh/MocA family oxidoreductase n=1 Tax=Jeotgalibacillus proteolyticus TaxID=2082395 RepID=A0A2S5GBJ8_9BACL|nr:Gfo/Idh/MocA family oxidoreductase [Jeotgalibacillus proteolyticus]PPA70380.1 gfo/Idh/MocA family oxidoreductase [Jeotgalibacillus proteolyticus]
MKLGIISFAHGHAYSYAKIIKKQKGLELAGIYDDDAARGLGAARHFKTTFYRHLPQLLQSTIDAVIVTSENAKHAEHVIAAARAKKSILCEKPIATTLKDAKEMIFCCEENNVSLKIAFPVRYNTPVKRARAIVKSGGLGRILAVKGTNRGTNPGGWFLKKELSGGGAAMDHTVHVVDLLRWFMGAEIKGVYAEIGNLLINEAIDDSGIVTMDFDNGAFATLDFSWSRNNNYPTWGDVTLEIIGTGGTLSVNAFDQKLELYSDTDGISWNFWGDDMNTAMLLDFTNAIKKGQKPAITGHDGLKALEAALCAYESAERGVPVTPRIFQIDWVK